MWHSCSCLSRRDAERKFFLCKIQPCKIFLKCHRRFKFLYVNIHKLYIERRHTRCRWCVPVLCDTRWAFWKRLTCCEIKMHKGQLKGKRKPSSSGKKEDRDVYREKRREPKRLVVKAKRSWKEWNQNPKTEGKVRFLSLASFGH